MSKFDEWSRAHNADNLTAFVHDDDALLWLKLKSIMRKSLKVGFQFDGKNFTCYSDAIFVIKN